jgi:hypothetical protein
MKTVSAAIAVFSLIVLILVGINAWHTLKDRKAKTCNCPTPAA